MTTSPYLRLSGFCAGVLALVFTGFVNAQTAAKLDPPVKPSVTGKFTGNGKNAALKYVMTEEHESFSGKEAITLIFSEKDPAKAEKPSFDAMFGHLGSALILNVFQEDGGIFGCQVVHSAHQKQGFSSLGSINMVDFKLAGGNVSGHVTTGKELDTFGEKWEVDLTFAAPLPAKLRNASPAPTKSVANESEESPRKTSKKESKAPAGPLISARKLPLPKDAANVQYKTIVNQIEFTSPQPVAAVAKDFARNLKQQGWKEGSGNMIGKQNAILKCEQGDAKLTIMIRPAATGSDIRIFTEGLDWSETAGSGTPPTKNATEPSADDVEAEANKLLNDALKEIPKGL